MKKLFFLLLTMSPILCLGQDFFTKNLIRSQWISDSIITDFNIGTIKKMGLWQLKVPIDSIKNNVSVWDFGEQEITIVTYYKNANSPQIDSLIVKCTYKYGSREKDMKIFHFSQDSAFGEYSLLPISTGSYISMTRKN